MGTALDAADELKAELYSIGSTIVSEFPPGSRSLNIGGTGLPQRAISGSTSTPAAFSVAWSASMSPVEMMMPVSTAVGPPSIGGVSAIAVAAPAGEDADPPPFPLVHLSPSRLPLLGAHSDNLEAGVLSA